MENTSESIPNHIPPDDCPEPCDMANFVPTHQGMNTDPLSLKEVPEVIQKFTNGHASGTWWYSIWVPQKCLGTSNHWSASTVHKIVYQHHSFLYKGKGSCTECGNCRPTSLLSVRRKVFAHVLLDRMQLLLNRHHHPQQSGFTVGQLTIDTILTLQLLFELHQEFNCPLRVTYFDIKVLWSTGQHFGSQWKELVFQMLC